MKWCLRGISFVSLVVVWVGEEDASVRVEPRVLDLGAPTRTFARLSVSAEFAVLLNTNHHYKQRRMVVFAAINVPIRGFRTISR